MQEKIYRATAAISFTAESYRDAKMKAADALMKALHDEEIELEVFLWGEI